MYCLNIYYCFIKQNIGTKEAVGATEATVAAGSAPAAQTNPTDPHVHHRTR